METDDETPAKPHAVSFPSPTTAMDRNDKEEPRFKQSRTDNNDLPSFLPMFAFAEIERLEPNRAKLRADKLEAQVTKSSAENAEPARTKARREKLDANCISSNTESFWPPNALLDTDKPEPMRWKDRKDKLDPRLQKDCTDKDEPMRRTARKDNEEAHRNTSRTLMVSPNSKPLLLWHTDSSEPMRAKQRIERAEPKPIVSKTLHAEPNRAKLRTERVLPSINESRRDMVAPSLVFGRPPPGSFTPNADNVEPRRTATRRDNEDPTVS
jgi:hypothetical protein